MVYENNKEQKKLSKKSTASRHSKPQIHTLIYLYSFSYFSIPILLVWIVVNSVTNIPVVYLILMAKYGSIAILLRAYIEEKREEAKPHQLGRIEFNDSQRADDDQDMFAPEQVNNRNARHRVDNEPHQ